MADIPDPVDEEAEANAHLIAASPEMLEALEAIRCGVLDGSIQFTKRRQSDSDPYHPANTLMCRAMAKARGEGLDETNMDV